ncbi:hypothetical protein Ddc_07098 [Ditylenchus destructor]|nr:hypothetical protein Ddc_07098 [Ditylenchus destructor]
MPYFASPEDESLAPSAENSAQESHLHSANHENSESQEHRNVKDYTNSHAHSHQGDILDRNFHFANHGVPNRSERNFREYSHSHSQSQSREISEEKFDELKADEPKAVLSKPEQLPRSTTLPSYYYSSENSSRQ